MNRLLFHVRLLWLYFAQYAKMRLSYRADFFTSVFASFAGTAASFAIVLLLFRQFPHLGGWTFPEVVFLYGFSLLPFSLFNVVSVNLYEFANRYLTEGRFDRILLRPVSPLFQILFESFRLESLQEAVTGSFAMVWAVQHLPVLNPAGLLLLPVWALFGAAIYISVFAILTALSFWIEDRIGLAPPVFNLVSFGRYPITIYDIKIKVLLSTFIPFAFATFYPTALALGKREFLVFFWAVPLVAMTCLAAALGIWRLGIRQYGSTGS